MSTGLNCEIIQATATEWFYVLEDDDAPKNAWDWREYARAYGPFSTKDLATDHLDRHHANPGGWWERPLKGDGTDRPLGEVYTKLFEEARSTQQADWNRRAWRPRGF